jgi:hypothetical protein
MFSVKKFKAIGIFVKSIIYFLFKRKPRRRRAGGIKAIYNTLHSFVFFSPFNLWAGCHHGISK